MVLLSIASGHGRESVTTDLDYRVVLQVLSSWPRYVYTRAGCCQMRGLEATMITSASGVSVILYLPRACRKRGEDDLLACSRAPFHVVRSTA